MDIDAGQALRGPNHIDSIEQLGRVYGSSLTPLEGPGLMENVGGKGGQGSSFQVRCRDGKRTSYFRLRNRIIGRTEAAESENRNRSTA